MEKQLGIVEQKNRESAGEMTTSPTSIDPLALHVAYVALAIFIG
ncbi:hypothetical protein [Sinobaca sp. H24]|nr:hypothetical protein [Sinobaca sp. H24]